MNGPLVSQGRPRTPELAHVVSLFFLRGAARPRAMCRADEQAAATAPAQDSSLNWQDG